MQASSLGVTLLVGMHLVRTYKLKKLWARFSFLGWSLFTEEPRYSYERLKAESLGTLIRYKLMAKASAPSFNRLKSLPVERLGANGFIC